MVVVPHEVVGAAVVVVATVAATVLMIGMMHPVMGAMVVAALDVMTTFVVDVTMTVADGEMTGNIVAGAVVAAKMIGNLTKTVVGMTGTITTVVEETTGMETVLGETAKMKTNLADEAGDNETLMTDDEMVAGVMAADDSTAETTAVVEMTAAPVEIGTEETGTENRARKSPSGSTTFLQSLTRITKRLSKPSRPGRISLNMNQLR